MEPTLDTLTGLPGREAIQSLRERFAGRSARDVWTLMIIDVDQFKLINDIYGHLVGDHVLSTVASLLRRNAKSEDMVLRYGGDEFLIVLPETSERAALNCTHRMVHAIRTGAFPHGITVSVSIGVAGSTSRDATLESLIERADMALYRAKEDGRDRVYFFQQFSEGTESRSLTFGHFVGRQRELTQLRRFLDESLKEGTRIALVTGEAGAGKSRLVHELEHYARFQQCSVLKGGCHEFGEVEPYAIFANPLRQGIRSLSKEAAEDFSRALTPLHPATSELFPGVGRILSDPPVVREKSLRFRIFEDICGILSALTMVRPVLFILDDLQWMSDPDLELLAYLVRAGERHPVLFVAVVRTEEEQSAAVAERIRDAAGTAPTLTVNVRNFDSREAKDLTTLALKDPSIPEAFHDMVFRHSGGNPFFLKELIKALIDDGCITPRETGGWETEIISEFTLPDSLSQVISRRLSVLTPAGRRMLQIASLTTDAFSVELLAHVLEKSEIDVAEVLDEPFRMGLIREDVTGDRRPVYRFAHDTVKSFLHQQLPGPMTAVFHARMAAHFEELYRNGREELVAATAYHYCNSAFPDKAMQYSLLAARHAQRRRANKETIRWLESYLSFSEGNGNHEGELFYAERLLGELYSVTGEGVKAEAILKRALGRTSADEQKVEVLHHLGTNAQKLSRYPEARGFYREALQLAIEPVTKVTILLSIVYLDYLQGRAKDALPRLEHARTLLENTPQGTAGLENTWASYFLRMADITAELDPGAEARAYYEEAYRRFKKLGDPVGEGSVLNNMSTEYSVIGDYERSLELLREAERIDSRLDDALGLTIVLFNLAETYGSLNQISLARDYYGRYVALSKRIKNRLGDAYGELGLGYLHELEGDLPAAEQRYRDAAQTFERLEVDGMAFMSRIRMAEVLLKDGKLHEAKVLLQELDQKKPREPDPDLEGDRLYVFGLARLMSRTNGDDGEAAAAEELLRQSLETTDKIDLHPLMKRYYYLFLALSAQGRRDESAAILERAVSVLHERLTHVKANTIRTSVLQIKEIRYLLQAANEHGLTV